MRRVLLALILACGCGGGDTPTRRDDGVFRAVILGDSVARGAGDESRRGIAGRLDDALTVLGIRSTPTANLGIDGARTGVVRRLLETTAARDAIRTADAVIVSIGGNDLYGDSRFAASRHVTVIRIHDLIDRAERISPLDRFHPSASGYASIAARIAATL